MKVSEVMTGDVEVVGPETMLREAAQKMKSLDVGPMPVCDGTRLLGMVTDRDLTLRATAEGKDPNTTPVRDVMTGGVEYCFADDDVREAVRIMKKKQIRRLVVLDRAKNLVGIVSLGDLATEGVNKKAAGAALQSISESETEHHAGRIITIIAVVALVGAFVSFALRGSSGGGGGGTQASSE